MTDEDRASYSGQMLAAEKIAAQRGGVVVNWHWHPEARHLSVQIAPKPERVHADDSEPVASPRGQARLL